MKKKNMIKRLNTAIEVMNTAGYWEFAEMGQSLTTEQLMDRKEKTMKAVEEAIGVIQDYKKLEKKYEKLKSKYETLENDYAEYMAADEREEQAAMEEEWDHDL